MNPISWIFDQTLGRFLRWAGREWGAGEMLAERQPGARDELLTAMAVVVAESNRLGQGYMTDQRHQSLAQDADGRVAAAYGRIRDDELAIIAREFLDVSRIVIGSDRSGDWVAKREALGGMRDRAAARSRQLEH